MNSQSRRPLATISMLGITHLHRQNPYIVAWWSAAFPGFGHFLLNKYLRATLLTLSEFFINTFAHINESIVYTFCGKFEMVKSTLDPRWVLGYITIYLFSIWDSYRSAVIQNKICHLAELENEPLQNMYVHPLEIQYLEQKKPWLAGLLSFFFPGLGQLYNHRFVLAFYVIFWFWLYVSLSRAHESIIHLINGNIQMSKAILGMHWLLFMPSVIGGAVHHAFITAIEHNRLYKIEQRQFLGKRYQDYNVHIFNQEGAD